MWGDLKVWSGTKEVTVVPWWYRLWRKITFAESERRYRCVAEMMDDMEQRHKQYLIEEAIRGNRGSTTGSDSGRQRDSAANLRELNQG